MSWRDRVLQKHARELDEWWGQVRNEPIPSDDEIESEVRANYLEAMRGYDPRAHLSEELHVRLAGASARGALDFELGRELLRPLQAGISAAADADVPMELIGVLPGSTVLVARPRERESVTDDTVASVDTSAADQGAREWLRMLSTAETEGDLWEWPRTFAALGQLVKTLDDHELDLSLTWLALSGQRRQRC